jgi:hypothetical protein
MGRDSGDECRNRLPRMLHAEPRRREPIANPVRAKLRWRSGQLPALGTEAVRVIFGRGPRLEKRGLAAEPQSRREKGEGR